MASWESEGGTACRRPGLSFTGGFSEEVKQMSPDETPGILLPTVAPSIELNILIGYPHA